MINPAVRYAPAPTRQPPTYRIRHVTLRHTGQPTRWYLARESVTCADCKQPIKAGLHYVRRGPRRLIKCYDCCPWEVQK